MTADRDIERLLDAWLADGPMQVSDHAFDEAVGRVHRQRQRPAWRLLWKEPRMSAPLKAVLGAAAIFVVVVAGFMAFGRSNQPGIGIGAPPATPSPTPTPSPSPSPAVLPDGSLRAGTYVTQPFGPPDQSLRVTFTVPDGWSGFPAWALIGPKGTGSPNGIGVGFLMASGLFSDPCHTFAVPPEGDERIGSTVDDLVNALAEHEGYVASSPTPVELAGYSGKQLDLQMPMDTSGCDGSYLVFGSTHPAGNNLYSQGPGNIWHLRILDVDGARVIVIVDDFAGTSAADGAEAQSIIDSITITP